jgi:hypothetical protein
MIGVGLTVTRSESLLTQPLAAIVTGYDTIIGLTVAFESTSDKNAEVPEAGPEPVVPFKFRVQEKVVPTVVLLNVSRKSVPLQIFFNLTVLLKIGLGKMVSVINLVDEQPFIFVSVMV